MEIPNIINPANKLIFLLYFVKNPITFSLHCAEINANKSNGSDIPTPKNIKLNRFAAKSTVDVLIANNTIREAGLQGNTINPKKKPKLNEPKKGFLVIGAFI